MKEILERDLQPVENRRMERLRARICHRTVCVCVDPMNTCEQIQHSEDFVRSRNEFGGFEKHRGER